MVLRLKAWESRSSPGLPRRETKQNSSGPPLFTPLTRTPPEPRSGGVFVCGPLSLSGVRSVANCDVLDSLFGATPYSFHEHHDCRGLRGFEGGRRFGGKIQGGGAGSRRLR